MDADGLTRARHSGCKMSDRKSMTSLFTNVHHNSESNKNI